jgi:hypothetical protein
MKWHTAMYSEAAVNGTNVDIDAALDEIFTRRNSHLIFTQPVNLLAVHAMGSTLVRARFGNAALIQKGTNHIWPVERSATVVDLPQFYDLRDNPLILPRNEELTIEATTDGAGGQQWFMLHLADPSWTRNQPVGRDRLITRATAVISAGTENTWTALSEITFERDLLNGVYAVVGAWLTAANAVAFRLRFPDQPQVGGRQFRPGGLVQDAIGNSPHPSMHNDMGEWGRFHTFTPPEVQVFADAAGGTYDLRLDLKYLGESPDLLGV